MVTLFIISTEKGLVVMEDLRIPVAAFRVPRSPCFMFVAVGVADWLCCFWICSSGTGRTGAFCAICASIDRIKTESAVDIFQIVKAMRLQRYNIINTEVFFVCCSLALPPYTEFSCYCRVELSY